jgi:uncharacterized membrane protein YciS (DUF1049 family)
MKKLKFLTFNFLIITYTLSLSLSLFFKLYEIGLVVKKIHCLFYFFKFNLNLEINIRENFFKKNALKNVTLINIQADQMILQTLDIKKKKTYLPFIHIEKRVA